ncbi:hypothetical protein E2C01_084175 [Portunus trituberculatus]|uniref:Uncharacterized protein n=1 Tax=Portunus trituberculatus TaxID=210409 RepID=A0A5B7J3K4_PORTR|nr:hypothetical protein [Portunus trituberculatus]
MTPSRGGGVVMEEGLVVMVVEVVMVVITEVAVVPVMGMAMKKMGMLARNRMKSLSHAPPEPSLCPQRLRTCGGRAGGRSIMAPCLPVIPGGREAESCRTSLCIRGSSSEVNLRMYAALFSLGHGCVTLR